MLVLGILINASGTFIVALYPRDLLPYHTSALYSEAWVTELLTGHPK